MALVSMRQLLDEAARGGYGVAAFNVNNMEQVQAIMEAASESQSPVIMQASRGARGYAGDRFLYHLMLAAAETYPDIPIALHQDHGDSPATCESAIRLGFTSVMMDGSLMEDGKTPADFEYNVRVTREVVELAHDRGVTVEGELPLGELLDVLPDGIPVSVEAPVLSLREALSDVEFARRARLAVEALMPHTTGAGHGGAA